MARPTANIYTVFDGDLMESPGLMAPPSNTYFARIHQALKPVTKDLNPILKELGIILVPMWRCSHRNKRWRCSNMTHGPNTKCRKCREARAIRARGYWLLKIISNSIKKDLKQMRQVRFIRCRSCKTPMLPRRQPRRGPKVLQMCRTCRRLRLKGQWKKSRQKLHCPYNKMVTASVNSDRVKNRLNPEFDFRNDPRYLTVKFLKNLRKKQKNKCHYCKVAMETNTNRLTNPKALQIERLTEGPHWASDCVLACNACNRRSWRDGWSPYPHDIVKAMNLKFREDRDYPGYLEGSVECREYERQENGNYVETGVTQKSLPSQMPSRRSIGQMERILEQLRQLQVRS